MLRRVTFRNEKRARYEAKIALKIQCCARRHAACVKFAQQRRYIAMKIKAARLVQAFIRWRNKQFQHAVTRVIARKKRDAIMAHYRLLVLFVPVLHRALHRFRTRKAKRLARERHEAEM